MTSRPRGLSRGRFLFLALLIALPISPLRAQAPASAADLAGRIDRHYNALHSLEVHFVQHYAGMGLHREESGVLLLKKPGRMRWTYANPEGKLFVLDGKNGYFYSPGQIEAQKVPAKQLDDLRSPLQFLLGHTELQKQLNHLQMAPGPSGTWVLSGVPKGLEKRVASMKIAATPDGTIRSMTIEEIDGVANIFDFFGEQANVPAPPSAFVFTPPPGVHVVAGMSPV
jgi:outer membrane lipoprotein carrier protein